MKQETSGKLKIIFFGLGSIGKKHAKIIQDNYNYDLYAYRTGKGQEKSNLKIKEFKSLEDAFSISPDIAFITNPTYLHIETALECTKRNINLFIEKPLSYSLEKINELEKEIKKRKLFAYVAYNLRFHPVIKNLKEMISKDTKPIYFRVICSSNLPDWRPEQDYSKSYSAKKELGGGVILDSSHEFDYIRWLFGEIKNISGVYGKISNLNINSEDFAEAQITCNSKITGNLHLDYFNPNTQRKIMIYYDDKYVEGDLIENTIKIIKKDGEKIIRHKCEKNETYIKQLEYFFEQYHKKDYNIMNNFSEALKTFKKIMDFKKECY